MPYSRQLYLALACFVASCSDAPRRPNVLLISIDTLRADRLGCYGSTRGTSPRIDELAAQATVFEAAHSSSAWTLPSLCTLMTGLAPSTHGATQLDSMLPPEHRTLAEHLLRAGYDTAIVASHIFLTEHYGLQQGFNLVDEELLVAASDFNRSITSPQVSERGIRFLDAKALGAQAAGHSTATPWFLWLHYFDPHAEYMKHEGISERFGTETQSDLYDGEIAFTDLHVGRVLEALQRTGLAENTVVVITADHGEEFGEHGQQRHGNHLHQEVVRVPLIVQLPPPLRPTAAPPPRVPEVVGTIDLLPSLLDLCELPKAEGLHGRSFVPLLRGESMAPREILMVVSWRNAQDMRALRTGSWSYHEYEYPKAQPTGLYRLDHDPFEQRDLCGTLPAEATARATRLQQLRAQAQTDAARWPTAPRAAAAADTARQLQSIGYAGEHGTTQEEPR